MPPAEDSPQLTAIIHLSRCPQGGHERLADGLIGFFADQGGITSLTRTEDSASLEVTLAPRRARD